MYKIGKLLGYGYWKEAYTVKGNPKKVLLVAYNNDDTDRSFSIEKEHARLTRLNRYGIPALKTKIVKVKFNKKIVKALLADRYHDNLSLIYKRNEKASVVKKLKSSLDIIYDKVLVSKVYVRDLQFLYKKNGEVVIADPLGVVKNRTKSKETLQELGNYLRMLEKY